MKYQTTDPYEKMIRNPIKAYKVMGSVLQTIDYYRAWVNYRLFQLELELRRVWFVHILKRK